MRFLIALLLLLFLSACSGGEQLAQAEQAIAQFHTKLNAGQIDRIHESASSDWKKAMSTEDAKLFLSMVRDKMGAFQSGKQSGWTVNYGTSGTVVIVQYNSKFAKGDALETFTFRNGSQGSRLAGYNINSKAMLRG